MSLGKEFKVSKEITLKLEYGKTNIYVKGELFRQCKNLMLSIPVDKISDYENIESIDDASDRFERSLGIHNEELEIVLTPENEFWGHCSNLQAWYENNYDTRLLHSSLAFPLLKKLAEIGDTQTKLILKEEIIKRLRKGYGSTFLYLLESGFINYISKDILIENLLSPMEAEALKEIEKITGGKYGIIDSLQSYEDYYEVHFAIRDGQIIELEMVFNKNVSHFPNCIKNFKYLKVLEIVISEMVKVFPETLPEINTLEEIRIFCYANIQKSFPSLNHLKKLKRVYLYGKYAKILKSLEKLKDLEILEINRSRISNLQDLKGKKIE
ncbi:MAG: hypothetical protein ACFFDF_10145 [Candidatus Odinarchaeota archaeon]